MTTEEFIHAICGTTYYRFTSKTDPEDVIFVSCTVPLKSDKICDEIGLAGYTAEVITEAEFEKETRYMEDDHADNSDRD